MRLRLFVVCLSALALFSCGKSSTSIPSPVAPPDPPMVNPPDEKPVLQEHVFAPKITDPDIDVCLDNHVAYYDPTVPAKKGLFLFFPGTGAKPENYKAIIRKASSMGYHAIGLMYMNLQNINLLCANGTDVTCHRRARMEILDGIDRHDGIDVNVANSIINRLVKAITYLNKQYPKEKWGQYLVAGNPDWANIIVAGHSQGGGHAGMAGKTFPVKRVVIFSSADYMKNGSIPDWLDLPNNASKYFSVVHTADELEPYNYVKTDWEHLGMMTAAGLVDIDKTAPPYNNSHTLITNMQPGIDQTGKFHSVTVFDGFTPQDQSGKYLMDPAWEYLIGQ